MPIRPFLVAAALALLLLPGAAMAASPVSARLSFCSTAERYAVFEGDMKRVRGAMRLQVRFTLQARTPATGRWGKVRAPGFGAWSTSAPGVRRYVYTKRLEDLTGPGFYRVRVDFRWRTTAGRTLQRMRRHTPGCKIPDYRPDLVPENLRVEPRRAEVRRYIVTIRNAGIDAAGPFELQLTVNGKPQPPFEVAGLAGGASTVVEVDAPACEVGSEVLLDVDPRDEVEEADEDANLLRRLCPGDRPIVV